MPRRRRYLTKAERERIRIATLCNSKRASLPYGQYICADGIRVLFRRDYSPLLRIYPDGRREPFHHNEYINWHCMEWFYHDGYAPFNNLDMLAKLERILATGIVLPEDITATSLNDNKRPLRAVSTRSG